MSQVVGLDGTKSFHQELGDLGLFVVLCLRHAQLVLRLFEGQENVALIFVIDSRMAAFMYVVYMHKTTVLLNKLFVLSCLIMF